MGSGLHQLCPRYNGSLSPTAPTAITLWETLTFIFIKRIRRLLLEHGQLLGLIWSTFGNYYGYLSKLLQLNITQGCQVREKYLENEIFSRSGKSGNFVDGQGNLERCWKVREKSGNLKINGYGRRYSENLFILFKRGKDVLSREVV